MIEIVIPSMTNQHSEDHNLIKQIAKQDQDSFALLYNRHSKKLYGYAFRILKNKQAAEDVLQETFLIVWKNAKKYKGDGRVIAWLFGIIYNLSLKKYNQKKTEPLNEYLQDNQNIETQIAQKISMDENKQKLQKGLEKLSIDHRTILELVFYEKMSMKEISQIIHIPIGTVKSRLNYAKKALKGIMKKEEFYMENTNE